MILDLKALRVHKFTLKYICLVAASLHQVNISFWASVDLKDIYLHIPICEGYLRGDFVPGAGVPPCFTVVGLTAWLL